MITPSPSHPLTVSFLWGLYLACSWTWCIGMYLPRIMIERFGWWGFIVFAVPNVLGCAAFGYVVRNRARSEAMIQKHSAAMTGFSAVTIAFHLFFVVWLFAELIGAPETAQGQDIARPLLAALIVFLLGLVLSFLENRDWLVLAAMVYAPSLATFALIGIEPLKAIPGHGSDSHRELAWLAPAIILGFLLCPYLDLTLHRAMQNSPSRHSFAIFGAAFFLMILLTCAIWFPRPRMLTGIVLAHILAQTVFTMGAHLREVRLSPAIHDRDWRWLVMALPLAAAPLLFIARLFSSSAHLGENLYLRFLAFYGLVFPAYAVLFTRISGRRLGHNRRGAILFTLFIIGSLPYYELGFLHHRAWALAIPLAALLLAAALPGPSTEATAPARQ